MNSSGSNAAPQGMNPAMLFSADFVANPFPLFAQLRSAGAVVSVPSPFGEGAGTFWLVTRLEEAVQVLKNRLFTVDSSTIAWDDGRPVQPRGFGGLLGQSMIAVDEPDHRRLRSLVSQVFTPKYIQSLRPGIQKIADDLIERVQEQGKMDLVNDYAFPLPINVILNMLGVPSEGQELIRKWSELFSGGDIVSQDTFRLQITQEFADYLLQIIGEKRAHPQDDLISQLVQIEDGGDKLSEDELLSMIALLIFAGHETTSNLIGNGTLMLFDHPEQLQRLIADQSLVPAAVEEFLRYNGPVLSPAPRYAREDVELGGQQIRKGDMVLTVLGSANRDETQFTNAEEMDIARSLNRHVAFGQGIHVCLGAPLARLEGDIAFTTLLRRLPNLRLAIPRDSVKWHGNFSLHGISSLPVEF
jgi:cytochrome P450